MSAALIPAALGAGSSLLSSQSNNQQIEANAQAQEQAAGESLYAGLSQASQIRSQADSVIGSTKAAAAGSGVQVGTGSVLDAIEESAYNIELDALTTESDTKRSYENQMATAASTRASKASGISTLLGATGAGIGGYATGLQLKG